MFRTDQSVEVGCTFPDAADEEEVVDAVGACQPLVGDKALGQTYMYDDERRVERLKQRALHS